jgi:hypothetical protein
MSGSVQTTQVHEIPIEQLATELSRRLHTPKEIALRFSIQVEDIWELMQRPEFYALVKQRKAQWLSSANTEARMRIMSQIAYMEAIPSVFGIVTDVKCPAPARIDAAKLLQKAAEPPMGAGGIGGAAPKPFQVNIFFDQQKAMSLSASVPASPVLEHIDDDE